jgi:hypothetical protein
MSVIGDVLIECVAFVQERGEHRPDRFLVFVPVMCAKVQFAVTLAPHDDGEDVGPRAAAVAPV